MLNKLEDAPALQGVVSALKREAIRTGFDLLTVLFRCVTQQEALKLVQTNSVHVGDPEQTDQVAGSQARAPVMALAYPGDVHMRWISQLRIRNRIPIQHIKCLLFVRHRSAPLSQKRLTFFFFLTMRKA